MPITADPETRKPTPYWTNARVAACVLAAAILTTALASAESASATATVSQFSVTPSTTQAGGHPNVRISTVFSEPTGLKDIALHLAPGLTANPAAMPFCPRWRLLASLCSVGSKAGSITIVAVSYGLELPVTRAIYNVRPRPGERLRLGVSIIGTYSRPGVAAELPITQRPGTTGLDLAVAGLPSEVGGIPVRVKELRLSMKGLARTRRKRTIRKRPFLTNPVSCIPATSVLNVTLQDAAATALTASSSFTPTGCA
jgi:hypothetical protein